MLIGFARRQAAWAWAGRPHTSFLMPSALLSPAHAGSRNPDTSEQKLFISAAVVTHIFLSVLVTWEPLYSWACTRVCLQTGWKREFLFQSNFHPTECIAGAEQCWGGPAPPPGQPHQAATYLGLNSSLVWPCPHSWAYEDDQTKNTMILWSLLVTDSFWIELADGTG